MAELPRFLVDGTPSVLMDVRDRALHYADGLFETLRVADGVPEFWDQHLARLSLGCERLSINMPDPEILHAETVALISSERQAVLKLIVSAGVGGRGYRRDTNGSAARVLALYPYPNYNRSWFEHGIDVCLCRHRLSSQPVLAGLKHLNRLDQVLARNEWENEYQEGVMCDQSGKVIEGTMSNIFVANDNKLFTPILNDCGVRGVIREAISARARDAGMEVREQMLEVEDITGAEAVFFTNSIIGVWQLRSFEKQQWPGAHPLLQQLRRWIDR